MHSSFIASLFKNNSTPKSVVGFPIVDVIATLLEGNLDSP